MTANEKRDFNDDELLANAIPIDAGDDEGAGDDELSPLDVDESPSPGSQSKRTIQTFDKRVPHEDNWNREPNITGQGAIHVKTFVTKLRLDAVEHMDEQINQWLDAHPEYEVKFVTTTVGKLVGKTTEEALFVNVWV